MRSRRAQVLAAVSLTIAAPAAARAQSLERFSIESVVAIDQFAGERAVNRPNITIDITAAVRLGSGWQIYVRPWFRQPRAPDWDRQIYQAAVRYEHQGRVAARVDAGYIASPVGLGVMDASAATNPTIAPHLSYFAPMLPFLTDGARVNAVASTYPLGAQVTFSTDRWDARGALVASTPTRIFVIGGGANPQAAPASTTGVA